MSVNQLLPFSFLLNQTRGWQQHPSDTSSCPFEFCSSQLGLHNIHVSVVLSCVTVLYAMKFLLCVYINCYCEILKCQTMPCMQNTCFSFCCGAFARISVVLFFAICWSNIIMLEPELHCFCFAKWCSHCHSFILKSITSFAICLLRIGHLGNLSEAMCSIRQQAWVWTFWQKMSFILTEFDRGQMLIVVLLFSFLFLFPYSVTTALYTC